LFEDDFRGRDLDRRKWRTVYGGSTFWNNAFDWDPRGIEVRNGLRIRAFRDNGRWKAGGISMGTEAEGFPGVLGGQVDVYARLPAGRGVGAALLLWPAPVRPGGGMYWPPEIDIVEVPSIDKQQVMTTLHWQGPRGFGDDRYDARFTPVDATQWHNYTVIWQPGRKIDFLIDNVPRQSFTDNVPDIPMTIGLQGFVAGPNEHWHGGAPDASTPDPWIAEVGYVRWVGGQPARRRRAR
jgi:hypothetical protein